MVKYQKGTFTVVPNTHILSGQLPEIQAIFIWLCSYSDKDGVCFPSRNTLADDVNMNIKTLDKYMKELEKLGLITKSIRKTPDGKNMSNLYQINILGGESVTLGEGVNGGATPSPQNGAVTISNINYTTVLSKESTEFEEEPPEKEDPCLKSFGFPLPDGYSMDSIVDDDREYHILLDPSGARVRPSEVSKLRKAYEVRKRLQTPRKSPNINRDAILADRILKKYSELCEREVGVTPKYGFKEKMAFTQAVKKYGAEEFFKVCAWYVQSDAKDEDKISPLLCTWTRTLNNYQLDTGNKL